VPAAAFAALAAPDVRTFATRDGMPNQTPTESKADPHRTDDSPSHLGDSGDTEMMTRVIVATMGSALAQLQSGAQQPAVPPAPVTQPAAPSTPASPVAEPTLNPIFVPGLVTTAPLEEGKSLRVGGDMTATITQTGDLYQSGTAATEAPLPVGYPAPTPPGAFEIKRYPAARRAVVTMKETGPRAGSNIAFWPLFNHIKKRDIAMTAPVEMDLKGMTSEGPMKIDEWSMAFLYRTVDQAPTGKDGAVEVYDSTPMTVLSHGYQGDWLATNLQKKLGELETWLEQSPDWERAGDVRIMGYNGPEVSSKRRWAEIQLPIKRTEATAPASTQSPAPAPAIQPEALPQPK